MHKNFIVDKLEVRVFNTREEMGLNSATDILTQIKKVISEKGECRIIFAAAPSQNDCLKILREDDTVDWSKVECFHMDEYHLLPADSDKTFKYFLDNAIFKHHNFKKINYLCCDGKDTEVAIEEYINLLTEKDIDICLCGVGENGHIAFNDPAYADFNDQKVIKEVEIDEVCRNQQLHDAGFASIDDVPHKALTLTIPTLLSAHKLYCIVPTSRKAKAIHEMLNGDISTKCPCSILRTTNNCVLYLDRESYGE